MTDDQRLQWATLTLLAVALIVVLGLLLAGCGTTTDDTDQVRTTTTVAPVAISDLEHTATADNAERAAAIRYVFVVAVTYATKIEQARYDEQQRQAVANAIAATEARDADEQQARDETEAALIEPGRCGGNLPPCAVLERESGGNYRAVNPTGCGGRTCGGAWQFDPNTWDGYGGYARAQDAPPEVQDAKAAELWDGGAGCAHWAAC